MIARAEALSGAGIFDERFFMSSEEVDLAYRIKQGGWRVVHLPQMTILHHVHMGKPLPPRMHAQYAFARRQYAEKHFLGLAAGDLPEHGRRPLPHPAVRIRAPWSGSVLGAGPPAGAPHAAGSRAAAFRGPPPPSAVAPHTADAAE